MTPITSDRPEQAATTRGRPGLNTDTLALAGLFIAVFAFLAAIFAVGLAARAIEEAEDSAGGGGTTSATGTEAVPVALAEFAITPGEVDVPAGAGAEHQQRRHRGPQPQCRWGRIGDGGRRGHNRTRSGIPRFGTYTMKCDVAGHAEAGMTGTLTVS